MRRISINGLRLSREMAWAGQCYSPGNSARLKPVHGFLAENRINMICCGIRHTPSGIRVSACVDLDHENRLKDPGLGDVAIERAVAVSVYPHRSDIRVPEILAARLNLAGIRLLHLVSSHAVVSVVIPSQEEERCISLLEKEFDLPASHTPFRQEVDMDITQFLKKYPETRATYVEERIKTYGINLLPGLAMIKTPVAALDAHPKNAGQTFHFASVLPMDGSPWNLYVLQASAGDDLSVDFIAFHGPHFGDRYRILYTALGCLKAAGLPLLMAGCTGASINLVLPGGTGRDAKSALSKGFEAP